MKMLLIGFFVCSTIAVQAQKLKLSEVPAAAKAAFAKANPNTAGEWEKENGSYEVNFKKDGKKMSYVINKSGSILETESEMDVNELPATVKTYVKQYKKGAVPKEAEKIVKANGETSYEVKVKNKELVFDSNGKMIKEEVEKYKR